MAKDVYLYGEGIPVSLEIRNNGELPLSLSGIPPEIVISLRKTGWNRGIVRTIPGGRESLTLGSGSSYTITVPWDQKDDQGKQVEPGVYYLSMNASGINAYDEVVILYPEGVLTGSISPLENVTSNGITARLESLTFSENGGFVTARIMQSPGSVHSAQAPDLSQVSAEYRIDGGPATSFREISEKDLENGIYQITWKTAPVPCSAKVLNIHATKIDPYQGDWNFSISLNPFSQCVSSSGGTDRNQRLVPGTNATGNLQGIPKPASGFSELPETCYHIIWNNYENNFIISLKEIKGQIPDIREYRY